LKLLVIGAAGMIGRKPVARLARDGELGGEKIEAAHCVDIVAPAPVDAPFPIAAEARDIAAPYIPPKLIAGRPDVIFLLASIVSREAESDFEKGYAVELDGTRAIFEAIRGESAASADAYRPRLVFTSSIAPFGETIPDDFHTTPLTSDGTQEAICELPDVSATVAERIEALRAVVGEAAVKLIERRPDPVIERIVGGWPTRFDASRARGLGFVAETDFGETIRAHIEDEHVGAVA
jgi:nucleoside-diphosphate-sugar epimerase